MRNKRGGTDETFGACNCVAAELPNNLKTMLFGNTHACTPVQFIGISESTAGSWSPAIKWMALGVEACLHTAIFFVHATVWLCVLCRLLRLFPLQGNTSHQRGLSNTAVQENWAELQRSLIYRVNILLESRNKRRRREKVTPRYLIVEGMYVMLQQASFTLKKHPHSKGWWQAVQV